MVLGNPLLGTDVTDGRLVRINRKEVLGTKSDFPTKKLAMRELELRIAPINSINYRALRSATLADLAAIWKGNALTQHKPSTQLAVRSQLKTWLVPYFGSCAMREVGGQTIQMFVQRCSLAPKSCRNLILTLRMMWGSARGWGDVSHDPFGGLVLPKVARQARFFFTLDEIQRIIAAASGPLKSFYWLAAETGMRAGELCGLRIEDVDFGQCFVNVKPSVWRGKVSNPKNSELDSAVRYLSETRLSSPGATFDVAAEPVEFGIRHQERNAVGSESSRQTEAARSARIPWDSALRAPRIPAHKRKPDG